MKLTVFTDGGSRGNPGPAACAFVVYEEKDLHGLATDSTKTNLDAWNIRYKCGKYLGVKTNNEAEYVGVIEALAVIPDLIRNLYGSRLAGRDDGVAVNFFLDSSLAVNQLNGLFKVKEPRLRELLLKIRELEVGLSPTVVSYSHVPREQNAEADQLVNQTLDGASLV